MMIRPIDEYPGKVGPVSSEYPDGKAQNITSSGDGTGTPWEAKLANDLFGFQQFITAKAGITPNGTPDNATASQQFEALWKLLNARPLTFNLTADANYTLTADQNLYGNLTITDTGVVLTAARDIIVDTIGRLFLFTNSTAQTLTVRTLSGTGIAVAAGVAVALLNNGTNVVYFDNALAINQIWQDLTAGRSVGVVYTNTTGKPISVNVWIDYGSGATLGLKVNGNYVDGFFSSGGSDYALKTVVPNGATYEVDAGRPIKNWWELR